MKARLRRWYRKIKCMLGFHEYGSCGIKVCRVEESVESILYRVETPCMWCGHKDKELLRFPKW